MSYQLHVDNQSPAEFPFIDAAIDQGRRRGGKFVIWAGDLFCCISHLDLGLIYSEEYKAWRIGQQVAYQKVAG